MEIILKDQIKAEVIQEIGDDLSTLINCMNDFLHPPATNSDMIVKSKVKTRDYLNNVEIFSNKYPTLFCRMINVGIAMVSSDTYIVKCSHE